jgi:ribosomal protein S18 acetylase RimI-like enzyme
LTKASGRRSRRLTSDAITVRPARPDDEDAVVALLYESATGMYDLYAGSERRALHVLRAAFRTAGNSASREVVTVSEIGGRLAAAMAAFPAPAIEERARRFLRKTLRHTPPWTWLDTVRVFRLGGEVSPAPPVDSLYVDALATAEPFRRRGAARALLAAADDEARALGLAAVSLETALRNAPAQALYESSGFRIFEERAPRSGMPGFMGYVKDL